MAVFELGALQTRLEKEFQFTIAKAALPADHETLDRIEEELGLAFRRVVSEEEGE